MTAHVRPYYPDDEPRPLQLGDETPVKTNMKTLIAVLTFCICGCAAVVAGFINMKRDIADHTAQLASIQLTIAGDHDIGVKHTAQIDAVGKTVDRIERKLDRWSGPPTVVTTTSTTTTAVKPN